MKMEMFKCDVCGKVFDGYTVDTGTVLTPAIYGRATMNFSAEAYSRNSSKAIANLDLCEDCYGYICTGLVERGCDLYELKMQAAEYIRRCKAEKEAQVTE